MRVVCVRSFRLSNVCIDSDFVFACVDVSLGYRYRQSDEL